MSVNRVNKQIINHAYFRPTQVEVIIRYRAHKQHFSPPSSAGILQARKYANPTRDAPKFQPATAIVRTKSSSTSWRAR